MARPREITVDEAVNRLVIAGWRASLPALIGSLSGEYRQNWTEEERVKLAAYLRSAAAFVETGRFE